MSMWLLIILFVILAIQLLVLLVLTSFAVTLFFGSPWAPTRPARAKRMLEFAGLRKGETVLDLGCGDGAILIAAVEQFGASKAIGYDINPVVLFMGNLRIRFRRLSKLIRLERKNIFTSDIPQVDVVATFLIPNTMRKMKRRLAEQLEPDTRIVSRGFQFPDTQPYKQMETDEGWFYLYRAGDLREDT